jgi:hypothetical protein
MGLEAEYERVRLERVQAPSSAELVAIRKLEQDLPALWRSETTTQEERQTIVRHLLERVLVEVVDGTEQVRVTCYWHGGNRTSHQLTRPVARLKTLSTYRDLVARAADLHRAGENFAAIAKTLNREGWRPAKRRDTFNAPMVHHLLIKAGVIEPTYRRRKPRAHVSPKNGRSANWPSKSVCPSPPSTPGSNKVGSAAAWSKPASALTNWCTPTAPPSPT